MYPLRLVSMIFILLGSHSLSADVSELPHLGFAEHKELGQALFIAALSADSHDLNNGQVVLFGKKKICLKIAANRVYPRKLVNFFIQGAAINNSSSQLEKNADHMALFATSIKGKLVQGDLLSFYHDEAKKQTTVSLNEIELIAVESDEFFDVVLSSFIGSVPPSREFREAILGIQESKTAKAQFAKLTVKPNRKSEVSQWLIANSEGTENHDNLNQQDEEEATPSDKAINEGRDTLKEIAFAQPPEGKPIQEQPSKKTEAKTVEKTEVASLHKAEKTAPQKTNRRKRKPSESKVNAQDILKSQLFAQKLLQISRKSIGYPRRAQQLRQTGSVLASVTIDRKGNLSDVTLLNSADYSALNKAVLKGIENAQPFPEIPDEIRGEQYSFIVPVTFALR